MKKFHVPREITLSNSTIESLERLERGEYIECTLEEFLKELSAIFPHRKEHYDREIELMNIIYDEYKFPTVFYNDLPLNLYKSPQFIDKENSIKKIIPEEDFNNYLKNIHLLCIQGSTAIIKKKFQYHKLGKQRLRNRKEIPDDYRKFKGFSSFIVYKDVQNIKEKDIICLLAMRNNTLYLCNLDTYEKIYIQGPLADIPIK